jgi:hypothetical protein
MVGEWRIWNHLEVSGFGLTRTSYSHLPDRHRKITKTPLSIINVPWFKVGISWIHIWRVTIHQRALLYYLKMSWYNSCNCPLTVKGTTINYLKELMNAYYWTWILPSLRESKRQWMLVEEVQLQASHFLAHRNVLSPVMGPSVKGNWA